MPENKYESDMSTVRIEALTDAVYAIAATILILNINVPPGSTDNSMLLEDLWSLTPQFTNFAISFFLLAALWIAHHRRYHFIKHTDQGLLWLNISSLLFVIIIPFSTSLYDKYSELWPAAIFFELNIMVVGLFNYWQWIYVTKDRRLVHEFVNEKIVASSKKVNLVLPVVSLVAIGVAAVTPEWSTLTYLTVPFIISRFKSKA